MIKKTKIKLKYKINNKMKGKTIQSNLCHW